MRSRDGTILYRGLRGARDRLIAPGRAAERRAIRPALEEVVLDAPHRVLQARPAEAASVLESFFLRAAAGRA